MNALLFTNLLNGAFGAIALMRQQGMTNEEINARLDRVDAGGEAITVDEVTEQLLDWQAAIDAGRAMP
jgi:DNA-binding transcriptional MerR regulator